MTELSVILNGARITAAPGTVSQWLAERGIGAAQRFIAVAVNDVVVPRGEWGNLRLADGDRIEIVQPMKGG